MSDFTIPRYVQKTKNYIGKSLWPDDLNFKGMMDDVRIYSYALSEDQIKDIYSGKEPVLAAAKKIPSIVSETATAEIVSVKNKNLITVLVIFVIAVAFIAMTGLRKKPAVNS